MQPCKLRMWLCLMSLIVMSAIYGSPALAADPSLKLIVPAYFYPGGKELKAWHHLIDAASKVPIIAIANPASGPGKQVDPAYTAIIQQAQAAHVKIIGYVSTSYAKRTASEIKQDIDTWVQFYPSIEGFFFDEQSSEAAKSDFYVDIASYGRMKVSNAFIVTNPGTICAEEYFSKRVADTICTVESADSLDKYMPPAWATKYPPSQFYGLAYKIGKSRNMQDSLKAAPTKHFGYVFVTDDKLPNPWDTLPPYWDDEVKALQSK